MGLLRPSWGRSAPAGRPAFLAAYYEIWIGLAVLLLAVATTLAAGKTPPLAIVQFIAFMAVVVAIQVAIGAAIAQRGTALRVAGTLGASLLGAFGLLTTVMLAVGAVAALLKGFGPGGPDARDTIGALLFVGPTALLGYLNVRAAISGIGALGAP